MKNFSDYFNVGRNNLDTQLDEAVNSSDTLKKKIDDEYYKAIEEAERLMNKVKLPQTNDYDFLQKIKLYFKLNRYERLVDLYDPKGKTPDVEKYNDCLESVKEYSHDLKYEKLKEWYEYHKNVVESFEALAKKYKIKL